MRELMTLAAHERHQEMLTVPHRHDVGILVAQRRVEVGRVVGEAARRMHQAQPRRERFTRELLHAFGLADSLQH